MKVKLPHKTTKEKSHIVPYGTLLLAVSVISIRRTWQQTSNTFLILFWKLDSFAFLDHSLSKACNRDSLRCNFIFSISARVFKARERVTGWPLRAHSRLEWGLAKSAARPLEKVECMNWNNGRPRSDAVTLIPSAMPDTSEHSINHLSYTLVKRSPVWARKWKRWNNKMER